MWQYIPVKCWFHEITHWYCPGCGVTRMLIAMARGEFYQAFRYNPLVFVALPVMAVLALEALVARKGKREPLVNKVPTVTWAVLISAVVLYGVMRNLPVFEFLAPTDL